MKKESAIIILLEHREEHKSIYGMNLTLYLGAKVLVANTVKKAIDLIETSNVVLLFVNNNAYSQDIGADLWKIFDKKMIQIPLFILGSSKVPLDKVTVFDSKIQLRDILKSMAETMNVTAKMMAEKEFPEHFRLPSDFILPGWQTTTDIFVKRRDKYEIYFEANDIITSEKLEKLKKENNFQLYINRDVRLEFVNSLSNQISAKLNDINLTPKDRVEMTATGYQMVMEQSKKIGLGDGTMELANSCIESMTTSIKSIPKLNDLLDILLADTESLRYKHSLLINYIGSHIIKKTPWANRDQQEKFSFICFFQNITLTKDEHVRITSDKQLAESNLTTDEKRLITNHAIMSAKLVANIEKTPFGVATLIKQHHGSNKGVGLSSLYLNISPLAIVFLFAQEWANLVFNFENFEKRPGKQAIINMLHHKYNKPGFNKLLPILHTLEF